MRIFDETGQPIYRDVKRGERLPPGCSIKPFFPGYVFEGGKSIYRGEEVGEGGYVYAEPGMYGNVALLDVASMHPVSAIEEDLFGAVYTARFAEIKHARIEIKHENWDAARKMLDGKLTKYIQQVLDEKMTSKQLADALKTAINSVYGLTSAGFDNPFRDPRNKDNIVAKRGALFMVNLKHAVWERGYRVAHIKTDSIKIPDATPDIIQFVTNYGREYGYDFEHEATYDRMCLVNDAVYTAKYATVEKCESLYGREYVHRSRDVLSGCKKYSGKWTATGTQFQVPYVFKRLFSHEEIGFDDMCETKSVTSALYLDMDESLGSSNISWAEELDSVRERLNQDGALTFWLEDNPNGPKNKKTDREALKAREKELVDILEANKHDYHFVGRVGRFCPIKPGFGGGRLLRQTENKKTGVIGYAAATGSKGYRWMESEMVKVLGREDGIDRGYYDRQVDEAVKTISEYGDFEWFVSDDPYIPVEHPEDRAPWE